MSARGHWLILLFWVATGVQGVEWESTEWHGTPAFRSAFSGWTAIVSPRWGRLVSCLSPDGDELLHMAAGDSPEASQGGTAGGHMVWLGPQERGKWPPPKQWEYAAAVTTEISGDELMMVLPTGTDAAPGLVRRYAWVAKGLRCSVSWSTPGRWHALHVFQLQSQAKVRLTPLVSPDLPAGFAARTGDDMSIVRSISLPQPCLKSDPKSGLVLHRGEPFQKFFFPLQVPDIQIGQWHLGLERQEVLGDEPDNGLPTQTFCGSRWDMVEVEQASPFLDAQHAPATSVVLLCFSDNNLK